MSALGFPHRSPRQAGQQAPPDSCRRCPCDGPLFPGHQRHHRLGGYKSETVPLLRKTRRPVGGALAPVARFTAGISRSTWSGVCGVHDSPVGGLAGKESGHVSAERCSELDLSSCDRGQGYTAQGIHNCGFQSGVLLLRLRGDVRATSPSSLWV